MTFAIAALVRPFALFVILCALAAVRVAIARWFPDSRLKRLMLQPV